MAAVSFSHRSVAEHAQGVRTRPQALLQTCPHPNACLSCNAFLTDESFRPILEDQRRRTSERAQAAIGAGHDRIAELNLADIAALDTVLHGPDQLNAGEADRDFDIRALEAG